MFGSILTDRFNDDSDVGLVVSFNKAEVSDYFDNYFDFKYALEELFGREVDLLEEQTIKNPYLKKNVDATKALIYGWFDKETLARYSDCLQRDTPLLWKLKRKISNLIEPVLLTEDTNNPLYADILKTGILITYPDRTAILN